MFRVTVDEVMRSADADHEPFAIKRFEQTVDLLDMQKLIAAINAKPRKERVRKLKAAA